MCLFSTRHCTIFWSTLFKTAFHDTDTDILARILARTSVSVSWNAAFTGELELACQCILKQLDAVHGLIRAFPCRTRLPSPNFDRGNVHLLSTIFYIQCWTFSTCIVIHNNSAADTAALIIDRSRLRPSVRPGRILLSAIALFIDNFLSWKPRDGQYCRDACIREDAWGDWLLVYEQVYNNKWLCYGRGTTRRSCQ